MDFGFELFLTLDLRFYNLDFRFGKIGVGYCPELCLIIYGAAIFRILQLRS